MTPDGERPKVAVTTWRRRLSTAVAQRQLLYTLGADYVECLRSAGGLPLLVPVVTAAEARAVLNDVDGLVLSGGNDVTPDLYGQAVTHAHDTDIDTDLSDISLVRAARDMRLPTLGICRGLQVMNVALGGTLHQEVTGVSDPHPRRPSDRTEALAYRHPVHLLEGSHLEAAYRTTTRVVTSLHHQGIDDLADAFTAVAHADDGLIEGIESADERWFAVGVQWHPEKMNGDDAVLFDAFVDAVRRNRTDRAVA